MHIARARHYYASILIARVPWQRHVIYMPKSIPCFTVDFTLNRNIIYKMSISAIETIN